MQRWLKVKALRFSFNWFQMLCFWLRPWINFLRWVYAIRWSRANKKSPISALFIFQQMDNLFNGLFLYNLSCLFFPLQFTFLYCYFSTKSMQLMSAIGQEIYESDWTIHQHRLQKYHLLIILRSQKLACFTGLNLVHCDLETFKEVQHNNKILPIAC